MLMTLGTFPFELGTVPFQELAHKTAWRHAKTPRFGARAANQFLGPDDETITLTGTLLPPFTGGDEMLRSVRGMALQGEPWPLVDGTGRVHGNFNILSIERRGTLFMDNGVARKIDFTIELERFS